MTAINLREDRINLRRLATEYLHVIQSGLNADRPGLHRAVNDLRMKRPVVLIEELPWNEMDFDGSLTLRCTHPVLREAEDYLRKELYRSKYFPVDHIFKPYVPAYKAIHGGGIGLDVAEDIRLTDTDNHIVSHEYHDLLEDEAALGQIHDPVIIHDEKETLQRAALLQEMIGDILPVRMSGVECFYCAPWDIIARYRGVTPLLMDLMERPEYTHRIMERFTRIELSALTQWEEQGLLDPDPGSLHCTASLVSDLPGEDFDGSRPLTRKNIWGRGMAQIFASVSEDMHREFDIEYMKRTIGTCGLSYYGCCEPLDTKLKMLEELPNLRKISITPWADVDRAAAGIGKKYVMASKPNPSAVAVAGIDEAETKQELTRILTAARRNGCSMDMVLKDISTCHHNPHNIFIWAKIAMQLVQE